MSKRNASLERQTAKLSQNVVQYILKDQQTLDQVTILFGNVLQEPWTKKVVLDLLSQLMEDEQTQLLRRIIDELPNEQKEVLIMRHYEDLSFKEIAEKTGVSINTALGRMRYALINIRKLLEENNVDLTIN